MWKSKPTILKGVTTEVSVKGRKKKEIILYKELKMTVKNDLCLRILCKTCNHEQWSCYWVILESLNVFCRVWMLLQNVRVIFVSWNSNCNYLLVKYFFLQLVVAYWVVHFLRIFKRKNIFFSGFYCIVLASKIRIIAKGLCF